MTHYQVDFVIIPTVCFSWENKQMLEGRKVVTIFLQIIVQNIQCCANVLTLYMLFLKSQTFL